MHASTDLDDLTERDWTATAEGHLQVALVGLGWWTTEQVLPALADLERCSATVAVSGTADQREGVAERWPTVERAIDYDAFVAGEATGAYDAVYVCTPNALHLPYVEAAAEHGKAVLCEKPAEASVERARRLRDVCTDADVPLMIGYRLQTDPAMRRLRTWIRAGGIGDPVHVQSFMAQPMLDLIGPDTWRLDTDLAGPGASVTDMGVYPINTTRFLLGSDPESVTASLRSESPAFESVPDEHATFTLRFPDGVEAQCHVSQNAALSGELTILGTEGTLRVTPAFFGNDTHHVTVSRAGTHGAVEYRPADQMREEFAYFAEHVLADRPIEPDGDEGVTDVEIVEAVYEAGERGERVHLD